MNSRTEFFGARIIETTDRYRPGRERNEEKPVILMFMVVATSAAFAGHDHGGSQDSAGQASSHRQADEQKVNSSELLLKNCAQHIYSIQQYIEKLQAKMSDKRAVSLIHGELEQLEQKLKEAKETVRALQVF